MFEQIATILVTAVTVLGSSEAFKYYKSKLQLKHKEKVSQLTNENAYADSLKERVVKMEELLLKCIQGKEELQLQLLHLTGEVSTLRERVKSLEKENERLKNK